jgi:hypothetical protein
MKRVYLNIIIYLLVLLCTCYSVFAQGVRKQIKVGSFWSDVMDSGDEGEGSWGWAMSQIYFDGFFESGQFSSKAMFLGVKNFTDTTGTLNNTKVAGHGQWTIDDTRIWMPVPDADGFTIHRYYRYDTPSITVDGLRLEDPYPFNFSDHGPDEADKIPGNADMLVESFINTELGISIHQRVIAYSQKNHDDYQIYEWTFKNTGNTDIDDDIELPNQTLEDIYFLRQIRHYEDAKGWASSYGELPGDSLRIIYGYPARFPDAEWDNYGNVNAETGMIQSPWFNAEAPLFASDASNFSVNDPNQPRMTGVQDVDLTLVTEHSNNLTPTQRSDLYKLMEGGFSVLPFDGIPDNPAARPGHHSPRFDERGYKYPTDAPWWGWSISSIFAYGPYTLAPGDSFRIVWAQVAGTISPEKAFEVGKAWLNGEAQWGDMTPGGPTEILPQTYQDFPELYEADSRSSEVNNWAKDNWVFSGRDTLFMNAAAAQFAYDNNYNVPQPPPPPSIEVKSLPDRIRISWGDESEAASDFAGYRVYRARGANYAHVPEDETELIGSFEMIFETSGSSVHEYDDTTAQRGIAYFYYVVAYDDGSQNPVDFHGRKESLESGRYLNQTTQSATLLKPAGEKLSDIRVVPNPFNAAASQIQFTGEPDKILFVNLPTKCTIRIYTEAGDLVKTIEHEGSGDEAWGVLLEEHQVSDEGQVVVSGVYLAYIETPEGESIVKKFLIVR